MTNRKRLQDICPATLETPLFDCQPSRPSIHPAVVYHSESPDIADRRLGGELAGYVYQRDGHPNAAMLAEKCRRLHGADEAVITSSGMSALSLAMIATLKAGDEILLSSRLYGKTNRLVGDAARFGITSRIVDMCDLSLTASAMTPQTRLVIVETISNPMLRVPDIFSLSEIAHRNQSLLLVDNTFASPIVCQPLQFGADLIWESITKIMNGHGDVIMGLLCGMKKNWTMIPATLSTWGMTSSPFDCWLAERGIATLYVRLKAASQSAMTIAQWLQSQSKVLNVSYPGLDSHPDHEISKRQFAASGELIFGHMLTFQIGGGLAGATRLIQALDEIPFCPSLGELATTLSHPASTSHRGQSAEDWARSGIDGGTIRLSVGLENPESICAWLNHGFASLDGS